MTRAICIKCGTEKHGAFTPCPSCNFMPRIDEDMALSLALTDRDQSPERLAALSEHIRQGKPIALREEDRQRAIESTRASGINRLIGRDEEGNDLNKRSKAVKNSSIWNRLFR